MTPAQFIARAGQLLYGDAWPVPLADELQISERTARRIAAAARAGRDYPVSAGLLADVREAVRQRAYSLATLATEPATPCHRDRQSGCV